MFHLFFFMDVLFLAGLITYMNNYIKTNDKIKYWLEGN